MPGTRRPGIFTDSGINYLLGKFNPVAESVDKYDGPCTAMTQINPFIGSILQSTTVQRAQAAEKNSHVQRAQNRAKDSATSSDQFEHQVESSDALTPVHDEDPQHPQQRKPKHPPKETTASPSDTSEGEGPAHIDVKV